MSLHLGNLSSHVHREELEHVFRRFGRCNVQLKDGYGFVVYDFPVNAEKALKALRGKNICGEPITLSWSNKQPRPFQRFSRGNRFYETQHGRNPVRGDDYDNRKLGPKGRGYRIGFNHPDGDGGRVSSIDMVDEATSYHENSIKEYVVEKHNFQKDLLGGGDSVQRSHMDNDRWGERVGLPSNETGVEDGLQFERYEPYQDDDGRKDEDGNQLVKHLDSSPASEDSRDKIGREPMGEGTLKRPDAPKFQQTCYICGDTGHKMRNCPRENTSRGKKLSRSNHMHDVDLNFRDKGNIDLKRLASKSRGRLPLSRDAGLMRQYNTDRIESGSRKYHRLVKSGNPQVTRESHRAWRMDHLEKKSRRENGTPERRHTKKAKVLLSSPVHSEYTASRSHSHSKSSKSASRSGFHSKSRSVSTRTRSQSFSSRSLSASQHSRSGSSKSRARSRSSSPTSLSLSVSLGHPLPSSPNKVQVNQKVPAVDAACPESREALVDQVQSVEVDTDSENSKLETMTVDVENNNTMASYGVEEERDEDQPRQFDGNKNCSVSKVQSEVKNLCSPLLNKVDVTVDSPSPLNLEMMDIQSSSVLVTEKMLAPTERPDSEALVEEYMSTQMKKPDPVTPVRSSTGNFTGISSRELHKILIHYGLDNPVDNEKDLSVESYFGSARLWPWEIIYYRRLRKGPISTENYARRIAQNKEFDIVDKYIRSSSGWAELGQDNF